MRIPPPQPLQNLEILLTFLILRVERSDLVRISDKFFSKLELDFEMLTWISWVSRWSFVAFRGDSRWSYSIVNTTENQQSCPSSVWLQNSDRSHLQYLRDCYQGSRQFSMYVRSGFNCNRLSMSFVAFDHPTEFRLLRFGSFMMRRNYNKLSI